MIEFKEPSGSTQSENVRLRSPSCWGWKKTVRLIRMEGSIQRFLFAIAQLPGKFAVVWMFVDLEKEDWGEDLNRYRITAGVQLRHAWEGINRKGELCDKCVTLNLSWKICFFLSRVPRDHLGEIPFSSGFLATLYVGNTHNLHPFIPPFCRVFLGLTFNYLSQFTRHGRKCRYRHLLPLSTTNDLRRRPPI